MPSGTVGVPVVIFSFDRPQYLEKLCRGLLGQTQVRVDPARVILAQDGEVSALTGHRHALPRRLRRSIEVFRHHFPEGEVLAAEHNLGIAENVLRGQRHVFETLDCDVGYFFEDDLEPGPLYLAALEAMRLATEPFAAQVGTFAAYGPQKDPQPGPAVGLQQLGHHWGFGLRRDAWRRICECNGDWWDEVRRNDYRARNRLRLFRLWRKREMAAVGVSQDAASELACAELGLARLNTSVCFARYIGQEGEHFTPGVFRKLGFDSARLAAGDRFTMEPVTGEQIARIAASARTMLRAWRAKSLEPTIAALEAERDDPDRLATEEEIATLWHLMLDRRTVPAAVIRQHAGRTTIRALRREIVRMREFQHQTGP
ncbi:hypothetical protein GXW78_07265 [Roseomonas terrae]|uniref:Glycosyl transferase family 2 n=1 Tax=Neoroseomonas terrae TaxID=424799 RepID=A0ABS5EEL0_9PROT|nr:hypothetical protein [Neoroseomonas terrae]MBR0649454.1 hypothetical protein [Neoroseomonas terrae]